MEKIIKYEERENKRDKKPNCLLTSYSDIKIYFIKQQTPDNDGQCRVMKTNLI